MLNTVQTLEEKADFLRSYYLPMLRALPADAPRKWGKLSQQGVIEHLADSVRIGNGRDLHDCDLTEAHIEKMHDFIRSDKQFRENTVNALMPAEPPALRCNNKEEALAELQNELDAFFAMFADDHERLVTNPFFGDLDYELWVRLLYKHAWHHLRQFGVEMAPPAG